MYFTIKHYVDMLGRIVLPKDMRSHYNIKTSDTPEIIATEEGILLKIFSENDKKQN